jgi:hypothetical protein
MEKWGFFTPETEDVTSQKAQFLALFSRFVDVSARRSDVHPKRMEDPP